MRDSKAGNRTAVPVAKAGAHARIASDIERRRRQSRLKRAYAELAAKAAAVLVIGWLLLTQVFLVCQVEGQGMFPFLKDGDLVFAFRLGDDWEKDDVVVCEAGGERHVLRVAAREGDVVTIDASGTVLVNGTAQTEEVIYQTYPGAADIEYPYAVPEGHVFVLGDYRTSTVDSRDFGPVPEDDVEGEAFTILRRRGL